MRAARAECDTAGQHGAWARDWRSGRLLALRGLPVARWPGRGGARWFRCDVAEVTGLDDGSVQPATGSLKGALAGAGSPLAYGCFNPKLAQGRQVRQMRPVACTAKHHAEFVGVWQAPDISYDEFQRDTRCARTGRAGALIAKYAKVPNNGDMQYRAGTIIYHPFEQEWRDGDRGVQCFLWVADRTLTRSVKGAGTKGLPVT